MAANPAEPAHATAAFLAPAMMSTPQAMVNNAHSGLNHRNLSSQRREVETSALVNPASLPSSAALRLAKSTERATNNPATPIAVVMIPVESSARDAPDRRASTPSTPR
jgi:hypothetical protein